MPKKGQNKNLDPGPPPGPPRPPPGPPRPVAGSAAAADPAVVSPGPPRNEQWKEALDEEARAAEEARMAERIRRAEVSQQRQMQINQRREAWEREQQRQARENAKEDRKWQAEQKKLLERAKREYVVESEDWGDGKWWANLGGGTYKEVLTQHYCTVCDKQLNSCSLEGHLESDNHKRKVEWQRGAAAEGAAGASASAAAAAVPAPSALMPPVAYAGSAAAAAQPAEDWQQMGADGFLRCIPCNKVVDPAHLCSAEHIRRIECWRTQREREQGGWKPPNLPYLAYVPDEENPTGPRWLKCLLCDKWVQDDWSHSGSPQAPAGSNAHQKKLTNYCHPNDQWYINNVVRVREKWHPCERVQRAAPTPAPWAKASSAAAAPAHPAAGQLAQYMCPVAAPYPAQQAGHTLPQADEPLPPNWSSAWDDDRQMTYYWHQLTQEVQWERPVPNPALQAPPAPQQAPPAPQVVGLPPGWQTSDCPDTGRPYYWRQGQPPQWEWPHDDGHGEC